MVAVQVRDVPDDVRSRLVEEARARGVSLQTYLLDVLIRESRAAHNRGALRAWVPVRGTGAAPPVDTVELMAQARAERDRELMDRSAP